MATIDQHIKSLLNDKALTDYRIGKGAGVDNSVIFRLRKGERSIENLRLATAEKLNAYYLSIKKKG